VHPCSILGGCAFQSALYSCQFDSELMQRLAREMERYAQKLERRARLPADEGEQVAGSSSSSGSSRQQQGKSQWVAMPQVLLTQHSVAQELASSCVEGNTALQDLMTNKAWLSLGTSK